MFLRWKNTILTNFEHFELSKASWQQRMATSPQIMRRPFPQLQTFNEKLQHTNFQLLCINNGAKTAAGNYWKRYTMNFLLLHQFIPRWKIQFLTHPITVSIVWFHDGFFVRLALANNSIGFFSVVDVDVDDGGGGGVEQICGKEGWRAGGWRDNTLCFNDGRRWLIMFQRWLITGFCEAAALC